MSDPVNSSDEADLQRLLPHCNRCSITYNTPSCPRCGSVPLAAAEPDEHTSCQSSDGPVRFYYEHPPTHGLTLPDHIYVSCRHHGLDPLPNDGRWQIVSVHPLTVTPSVHWTDCGCHGFITNGEWIPA